MYLLSDDVEVMLISRVIRSFGLDNNGKLVQRWKKIDNDGDEWKWARRFHPDKSWQPWAESDGFCPMGGNKFFVQNIFGRTR